MKTDDEILREREPDLEKLERERDALEIQGRFYRATGILYPHSLFPLSQETIATLRVRDQIHRLPRMKK